MKAPPLFKHEIKKQSAVEVKEQVDYNDDFLDLTSVADHDIFGIDSNESKSEFCSPLKKKNNAEDVNSKKTARSKISPKKKEGGTESALVSGPEVKGKSSSKSDFSDNRFDSLSDQSTTFKGSTDRGNSESVKPLAPQMLDSSSFLEDLIDLQDSLLKPRQSQDSPLKSKEGEADAEPVHPWPWSNRLLTDWSSHTEV